MSGRLINQPAFAYHRNAPFEVPGIGTLSVDVAWGGMTYVLAESEEPGFAMTPDEARDLSRVGDVIKAAAVERLSTVHPDYPEFAGITQTEIMGPIT